MQMLFVYLFVYVHVCIKIPACVLDSSLDLSWLTSPRRRRFFGKGGASSLEQQLAFDQNFWKIKCRQKKHTKSS